MQRSLISNSSSLRQAVLAAAARRHQSSSSSSTAAAAPTNWVKPTEADQQKHDVEQVFRAGLRHHHIANTAYPIGHLNTIREYRVPRLRDQKAIVETLKGAYGHLDEMMLYAHVPFCAQRCQFCEYTVVNPKHGKQADVQEIYFDHMLKEIEMYSEVLNTKAKRLVGFDIGGGTPSMASIKNIERLMNAAHTHFKVDLSTFEISIETTPQIAASNPEKIQSYFDLGIRRISMGLQTTDFNLAKRLGRQDGDYVTKAVENIRKAGFKSFNIDLMYGFPLREGGRDSWPETVQDCINVNPDHITLYRMRYKGTKMAHLAGRVPLKQVNAQEARARAILESNGYSGWIGKNTYSKTPGSSGCSDYLHRRVVEGLPYIGVGLGAQSFSHNTLAYNLGAVTKKLNQYLRSVDLGRIPIQDLYHLPPSGAMGKMAAVSFYFGGIDRKYFRHCFNQELDDVFAPQIKFLMENNLMVNFGERLQLTAFGKKHFAGVVSLFYAPAVQNHLMNLPGGEQFDSLFLEDSSSSSSNKPAVSSVVEEPTASAASAASTASAAVASASSESASPASTAEALEAEIRAVELSMSAGGSDWAKRLTNGSILMKVKGVVQTVPASSAVMTARAISSSATSPAPAAAAAVAATTTTTATTATTTTSPEERMSTGPYEFGNILFGGRLVKE